MPRVVYNDPTGVRRDVVIRRTLRIGRHPGQDLQLLDNVVSKEHAILELDDSGSVIVSDRGSRNGTLLNGEPLIGQVALKDGDQITVGATVLNFHDDDEFREKSRNRVTILEEGVEAAVRQRLKEVGSRPFMPSSQIEDVQQLRDDYEKLRIANELSQALASEFEKGVVLRRILEKAFEMFGADRAAILLMNPETGELVSEAVQSRYKQISGNDELIISQTILNEVVEEKTAVLSSNAQLDERFGHAHSVIIHGIKSTMSVPLLYRSKLLGVIHLDTQMASGAFTSKDLSLLTGFANQAASAIEHASLVEQLGKEAMAREQLGRLLPTEMVDEIVAGRLELRRGGTMQDVSVLFADIRGFTSLSEKVPAQEVVEMLNEYFEIMVEIIFRHGGTLDKFIGDEIMAVWGAPIAMENHCERAVQAALEMGRALDAYNILRASRGLRSVEVGIGINSGEVVAGFMGSSQAMDHTVIGDVVNTANRICSHASGGLIIVGSAVKERLGDRLVADTLPPAHLKGKAEPVPVFRVRELKPGPKPSKRPA